MIEIKTSFLSPRLPFCAQSGKYTDFPPVNINKVACLALLPSGIISLGKVTHKGFLFSSDIFWPSCLVCLMSYVISTYSTYVTACLTWSEFVSTALDLFRYWLTLESMFWSQLLQKRHYQTLFCQNPISHVTEKNWKKFQKMIIKIN